MKKEPTGGIWDSQKRGSEEPLFVASTCFFSTLTDKPTNDFDRHSNGTGFKVHPQPDPIPFIPGPKHPCAQ